MNKKNKPESYIALSRSMCEGCLLGLFSFPLDDFGLWADPEGCAGPECEPEKKVWFDNFEPDAAWACLLGSIWWLKYRKLDNLNLRVDSDHWTKYPSVFLCSCSFFSWMKISAKISLRGEKGPYLYKRLLATRMRVCVCDKRLCNQSRVVTVTSEVIVELNNSW